MGVKRKAIERKSKVAIVVNAPVLAEWVNTTHPLLTHFRLMW